MTLPVSSLMLTRYRSLRTTSALEASFLHLHSLFIHVQRPWVCALCMSGSVRVGGQYSEECNDPQIRYRGCLLRVVDDEEDVRHLGFWATPNGDWKGMVDRVHASTLEAINIVKHSAKVVSPSAGVNLFNSLAVSVFRYSAALSQGRLVVHHLG